MRGGFVNYLFIDTCGSYLIISIVKNMEMIYLFKEKNDTNLSSKIMPIMANAFNETNLKVSDINKIFVVNGPGSFTGIRVGVTIAKVIGSMLNIPLIKLSELEFRATTKTDTEYNIPIIDARRGYVYTGIYNQNLDLLNKEEHKLYSAIKFPESYTIINDETVDYDVIKIIKKHEFDEAINPHHLIPNYLKKTEAEEKLND